jgi:ribosomal protein L31
MKGKRHPHLRSTHLVLTNGATTPSSWVMGLSLYGLEEDSSSHPLWRPYDQEPSHAKIRGLHHFKERFGSLSLGPSSED